MGQKPIDPTKLGTTTVYGLFTTNTTHKPLGVNHHEVILFRLDMFMSRLTCNISHNIFTSILVRLTFKPGCNPSRNYSEKKLYLNQGFYVQLRRNPWYKILLNIKFNPRILRLLVNFTVNHSLKLAVKHLWVLEHGAFQARFTHLKAKTSKVNLDLKK